MTASKRGLSFYRVDTDRYQDRDVKRLKKAYGCKGIAVYDYLLCEIYRVEGCFIPWDENTAFDVADYFGIGDETVKNIVEYCGAVGLFNKELLMRGILSSASIQRRFTEMCSRAKRKVPDIPPDINLLSAVNVKPRQTQPDRGHIIDHEVETLKTEECWIDQLQVLHHMNKDEIRKQLDIFRAKCIADGKTSHESMADAKQHFNNWLRITNRNKENDRLRSNILRTEETKTYTDGF